MNAMKKMIAVAAVAVAGFAAFAADEGAAPTSEAYSFTYQACLRDEHGRVITNAAGKVQRNQNVTLRLWDSAAGGEKPIWARKFAVFTDETGLFNLEVSDSVGSPVLGVLTDSLATALTRQKAGQLYIGLEVENSAGEIVPRQRLFAVPFAAVANDVRAITQDVPVSGTLTFAKDGQKVTVSADGISQTGDKSSKFSAVEATTVVAKNVKVEAIVPNTSSGKPIVTVEANINCTYDATVQGSATVQRDATVNGNATVNRNATVNGKIFDKVGEVVPVPVGGVIMWTKSNLPDDEHWAICDGGTYNGVTTPDLRGLFVVGAGKGYDLGATGGAATVTLTAEQTPLRKHSHVYWGNELQKRDVYQALPLIPGQSDAQFYAGILMNTKYGYTWALNYATSEVGDNAAQPHNNIPPYYALYYIMRIK